MSLSLQKFFAVSVLFFFSFKAHAQFNTSYHSLATDFKAPLQITPVALAGSFGELRANHFHSGLDFKTNQQTGYPVFATEDGYVARIRVQNSGFGLALYLNHPNGYTSVYGHLSRFNPKIEEIVKTIQYKKKLYELDEYPNTTLIKVRKGDIIAYSGNTGSSGGPHLHFELRDSKTEATINPQRLGIQIPDQIPPVVHAMYVYRLNGQPFNEFTPKQYFQVIGSKGNYSLNNVQTINLYGEVGFGIVTTDKHNGLSGTNGVYSIKLEVDGTTIFTSTLEKFNFENSRAINSHVDYPSLVRLKQGIQKSFVDPGNPLQIYSNLVNNGKFSFLDNQLHQVKYTITDAKGNESTLAFKVLANTKSVINTPKLPLGTNFSYNKLNEFSTNEIKVILSKGTLYNDLNFVYERLPKAQGNAFSAVHKVHNDFTPLHNGFELWIKADSTLAKFQQKALIVNSARVSEGGFFENGYVKAQPKKFGSFYIAIDTIAPNIVPLNITNGKKMNNLGKISFKISDNLSGIKSFNGYIDGKWVLLAFDAKTANLWHTFDAQTLAGKHVFELWVTDLKDNLNKYSAEFYK